jgi:lipopolysaccharide export system permease protein
LLSPFLTSLAGLCFIIFTKEMLRLVDLMVSRGISVYSVGKIVLILLPSFLVLTLPIACLIATISGFNRLSFDQELTAIRAAGVGFWRILLPVAAFCGCVFIFTLFLSQWGQPWSNVSLKDLAMAVVEDELTLALDSGVFNEPFPGMMVYVPDPVQSNGQSGIFISDRRNPEKAMLVVANSYRMLRQNDQHQLGIRLFEGAIHQVPEDPTSFHRVAFQSYDFWLPPTDRSLQAKTKRKSYEELVRQLAESDWKNADHLRRLMEYYKDTAFPVATFLLGFLGVPVGIVSKRSGKAGGFAIGVLLIIGFYVLNVLGEFLVTSLFLSPFSGAWLPNVVLAIMTAYLLNQARRG